MSLSASQWSGRKHMAWKAFVRQGIGPRIALVVGLVLALGGYANAARLPAHAAGYDWLQFDGNPQHSGNNTQETTLNGGNVAGLQLLHRVALPATADGAPVYLGGVATANGTQDLLFLTTTDGRILALDAHTGVQVWAQQYGPGACRINDGSSPCYTTSSPAIDPNRQYVYSYGLDGAVHKYAVGSGAEVTGGGWPEIVTLKGFDEKGSSALSTATARDGTSYLYMTQAGYPGDHGDYQGHVTAINLASGAQRVFNAACSDQAAHFVETPGTPDCPHVQTAVWARPGVVYDPDTDRIYFSTGNGDFDGAHNWGDTILALAPDGTGANGGPLDSYTPSNYQQLQDNDQDLGSTSPAILPVPANSAVKHLAVQSGKDGKLRLLNLDNLSGQGGPGHTGGEVGPVIDAPQGGEILPTPAVWVNPGDGSTWVFVAGYQGLAGLQLTVDGGGTPRLHPRWRDGAGGTSPLVANGVLYTASGGALRALDPASGHVLWQDTTIGSIHWESPIVANGMLYLTDGNGQLSIYGLPQASPTATPTNTPVPPTATAVPSNTPVPPTATPMAGGTTGGATGYGNLAPAYNNAGITDDNNPAAASFDAGYASYSAQTLQAAGLAPGQTITYHGLPFRWPNAALATPDNVAAQGQTIALSAPTSGSTLAILGAASNGDASGTATVVYGDGSTQSFTLGFSDWTLGGGTSPRPSFGNAVVAVLPYRNRTDRTRQNHQPHVFEAEVGLRKGITVTSVTLPGAVSGGTLHVFAITVGTPR